MRAEGVGGPTGGHGPACGVLDPVAGGRAPSDGPGVADDPTALAVPKAVAPEPGDPLPTKWTYSAFVRTDPAALLSGTGRDQFVAVGVYAHTGVPTTTADAWMRDVPAFVVAVADFSRADNDVALRGAAGRCAVVTTTDAPLGEG